MNGNRQGRHPADRLIGELIRSGREATPDEIVQIVERMATAPFDPRPVRVAVEHRGMEFAGRTLGAREDSLAYHLFQRVVTDAQWGEGTTADEYVADLRQAIRAGRARLAVYERRGGHMAAAITSIDTVLAPERRGERALPNLLVVYAADRGIIVTGYQYSVLESTGIPKDAQWLK